MLRVQCRCDKFLKVSETLAGKKIKCPSCGEVLLVKGDASSKPAVLDGAIGAGPPLRKMAASNQKNGSSPLKNDAAPSSKIEKTKKRDRTRMLLLAGGSGVLLLAVVVGGVLIFSGGEKPAVPFEARPAPAKTIASKPELATISLFVPHRPGDKRRVYASFKYESDTSAESTSAIPPEMVKQFAKQKYRATGALKGEVQTLKVNDIGEETEVKLTLSELSISKTIGEKTTDLPAVPEGTEAIGTLGTGGFGWQSSNANIARTLSFFLSDLLVFRYATQPEAEADSLFGTDEPRQAGASWPIKGEKLALYFRDADFIGALESPGSITASGTGSLVSIFRAGEIAFNDLRFKVNASGKQEKGASATARFDITLRLPSDGSTGPVNRDEKGKMEVIAEEPLPAVDGQAGGIAKMKMAASVETSVEIRYLGNFPIKAPNTFKAEPVRAQLYNIDVQWMEEPSAAKVSVSYTLFGGGKPKPDADYILMLKIADSGGVKRSYVVQARKGAELAQASKFANPSVKVNVPAQPRPAFCEIVLVEKGVNSEQETEIARADKVEVKVTSAAPVSTQVAFELSGHKVEVIGAKKLRFTVDYKVTSNKPDPKKTYRLIVNMEGKAKLQAKPFEVKGSKLALQDSLVKELAFDVPVGTKFSMSLTEDDGTSSPGVTISNVLSGKVQSAKDSALLQIQIVAAVNKVLGTGGGVPPGVKKGGIAKQQQQLQLTLQWNVTAGEINKKAVYTVVVDLKGGKAGALGHQLAPSTVQGAQFQPSGGPTAVAMPYLGETSFDCYILEQIPGQPPQQRKVSNTVAGKIQ